MGSEQIHYEALRRQMIMDRRNYLNIERQRHKPPYQPHYVTYELPKDDMYVTQEATYKARPTVHEFRAVGSSEPWKFMSLKDIHGDSSISRRNPTCYSAKMPNRYNVIYFYLSFFF